MNGETSANVVTNVLRYGLPAITLFLITGSVTDPVNAPKLFLLGLVGLSVFGVYLEYTLTTKTYHRALLVVSALFVSWGFVASIRSNSPFSQNFYGVYGRNTGLLAYCLLVAVLLSATILTKKESARKVILGFLFAGVVNLIYGAWVHLFGDFVGWNNPYGAILGTFGNPNFISSFLGMLFGVLLIFAISPSTRFRTAYIVALPLTVWELTLANSLQGLVIAAVATWLVATYWLYCKFSSKTISLLSFLLGMIAAVTGVLGAFNWGPLSGVMAQPTVALRAQYWYAALQMAESNPWFGVGMDGYGDWYRRARGAEALITPGPEVVTNVAHNVFLDLLAYGGLPLFLMYLAIVTFGLFSIVEVLRTRDGFDSTFAAIAIIWLSYQIQSLISINQLGLAIWGWLSTGLLIAYTKTFKGVRARESQKVGIRNKREEQVISPALIAMVGSVIGAIIAVPPLSADMKWRSLMIDSQKVSIDEVLNDGYLTPYNSFKLASVVQLLENGKRPDIAIKYARIGVEFNPDYCDAWKMLYYATESTLEERQEAKLMMIKLDPLNTKIRDLP